MKILPISKTYAKEYAGFRVRMAEADAELELYGEIVETRPVDWWTDEPLEGNWIVQSEVLDELKTLQSAGARRLTLRINSVGGDAGVSITIHNRLREMQRDGMEVVCVVDGVAMSGGSLIMCACDTVRINPASLVMIHKCWSFFFGGYNADELRQMADSCDAYDRAQASIYCRKTGLSETRVLHMMGETTYMTGEDAVEQGFADELLTDAEPVSMAASASLGTVTVNGRTMRVEKSAAGKLEEMLSRGANSEFGMRNAELEPCESEVVSSQSAVVRKSARALTGNGGAVVGAPSDDGDHNTENGNGTADNLSALRTPNSALKMVSAGEDPEDIKKMKPEETGEGGRKTMAKNLEELRAENPELAAQVEADVRAGLTAGQDVNAAVEAERERLKAIDEISGLYAADAVREAKYGETPLTAEQLAFREAKKAAAQGTAFAAAMMEDAKADGGANAVKAADAAPDRDVKKTDEQKQAEADSAIHALLNK